MYQRFRQEDALRVLLEKDAICATLNRLFRSTDEGRWEDVETCFAPTVLLDMTSLAGGEPRSMSPREIASEWRAGLEPLDAVHHQAGNFEVDVFGDSADAFCYGMASHYRAEAGGHEVRTFVGTYDFHLRKARGCWRIDRLRFNLKYVDDRRVLESVAGGME